MYILGKRRGTGNLNATVLTSMVTLIMSARSARQAAAKWFWYGGGTAAAVSLPLGVWLPAVRAYDQLDISFIRLTPLYFSYFVVALVALWGLFRRNRDVVGVIGAVSSFGAALGLAFCIGMVINGPRSNVHLSLSWGHFVLNVAGAYLLWLGFSYPLGSVGSHHARSEPPRWRSSRRRGDW